jgi:hypothetical protein
VPAEDHALCLERSRKQGAARDGRPRIINFALGAAQTLLQFWSHNREHAQCQ